jgi:hypothetical protein
MDSQDRGDPKIRRREEMLARRVGDALDHLNRQDAAECPDAEVIAAYAEQALAPAESAKWEGHFATCARCRKILRVLAASVETPLAEKEVARLGELVSTVRSPVEITARSASPGHPRVVDWRRRWLAPALGVAAVLVVWLAMRPPWRATNPGTSTTLIAQAPNEELPISPAPSETDRLSRVAPRQDLKTETAPQPDRSSANPRPLNAPVGAPAKDRADAGAALDSVSPKVSEERNSLQAEKKLKGLQDGREFQPPAIPPPPSAPPKAAAAMRAPAAPQSEAKASSSTMASGGAQVESNANAIGNAPSRDKQAVAVQAVQGEAAANTGGKVAPTISPEARASARKEQPLAVFRQVQKYDSLLKAPSGSAEWRAGKGGIVERSTDAGKTWVSQASPFQEDWLAGAAVSDAVCWLVGRNGAIARTADGEHWERIAPPSQAAGADAKLPDWNAITALDGQSSTITANDGRRFATADAGKTWRLQ